MIEHAKDITRLMMSPWKQKHSIYHFKLTKSITEPMPRVNRMLSQLSKIKSEKPNALMVSINTSSGSFIQAQRAHDAFKQFSHDRQVALHTFAEDMALGVGYYLLSMGDNAHANPFSLIGDISLNHRTFGFDRLLQHHNVRTVQLGHSALSNAFQKLTEEQQQFAERHLQLELEVMIQTIKQNRRRIPDSVLVPKVYNAEEAVQHELVDHVLTFEEYRMQYYPNSSVKEISLEKELSAAGLVQARQQYKLLREVQTILAQSTAIEADLVNLFRGYVNEEGIESLNEALLESRLELA